jgi:hypothetical protein
MDSAVPKKYVYLVKWWRPFPVSEYGGLIALIASDEKECRLVLERRFPEPQYKSALAAAIFDATRLELTDSSVKCEILEAFVT